MPCYESRDDKDHLHLAEGGAILCRLIKDKYLDAETTPDLSDWWDRHQKRDEANGNTD